jgi:beta-lactamase regulating signal transducer with metallopeptidase domain
MIEILINFFGTAFFYCALAVAVLWSAERLRWLRDGALAEIAWRAALWIGILIATVSVLRTPVADRLWSMQPIPAAVPRTAARDAAPAAAPGRTETAIESAASAVTAPALELASTVRPLTHIDFDSARWLALLIGAALLLAVIALLRSIWLSQRLLWRARHASWPADAVWQQHRHRLAPEAGAVAILSVADLDSPIAAHARLILLPAWCDGLPSDAQRALLAHELAHIERQDPRWRLCDAIAVALLAGFPFARQAQSRLHDLSEFACDAEAARRSGSPRALAECLAHCLEHALTHTPALAVAMATPARGVVVRVQRLLEEHPMFWNTWSTRSRVIAIAAVVAVSLILPGIAVTVAAERGKNDTSISIRSSTSLFGHDSISASYSGGDRKLKIGIEGDVQFNDAETAVTRISEGGELHIVEVRDGIKRELRLQPEGNGFARLYRVDGDDAPYDAAAEKWLAAILPDIFRTTGLDAEARLKRILARGGVEAVLAEIALIHSDYVSANYIGGLFAQAELDTVQIDRVVALMAAIESDYELRRALTPALAAGVQSEASQVRVLALAADMESDYECAELLIAASKQIPLDGARLAAWSAATADIDSDYEQRRVLEALLAQKQKHPAHAELAIAMADSIGSDYEKRMLLEAAAGLEVLDRSAYVRVARSIGSDYERREALIHLLANGSIDKQVALDMIAAAGEIGSDYEAKELLLAIAKAMPSDPQLIEAYRSVTRKLSPYERGEAEAGLDRFYASA